MNAAETTINKQAFASHWRTAGRMLLAALMLLCLSVNMHAADLMEAEHRVKTAFIYNFARFTSWPAHDSSVFKLCVLGNDPLGESLEILSGKSVHEETVTIVRLDHPSAHDGCELVYIGPSYSDKLGDVVALLQGQAILTVSDIDAFIDHGGIIGFRIIDNRIRFEINAMAATRAGLSISSRLLSLASRVRMDR